MCLKNKFIPLLCAFIISSCANIVSPEGGKKDTIAPYALYASPKDSSLNFKSSKIIITFNETIQIKDPKTLTISPRLKKGFEADAYKKKLTIKLKNLLSFKYDVAHFLLNYLLLLI